MQEEKKPKKKPTQRQLIALAYEKAAEALRGECSITPAEQRLIADIMLIEAGTLIQVKSKHGKELPPKPVFESTEPETGASDETASPPA